MFRFRPRFTVRTLAIFVTLVCVYFGSWEATKRNGVPLSMSSIEVTRGRLYLEGDILIHVIEAGSLMPFVVWRNEIELIRKKNLGYDAYSQPTRVSRRFYIWLLGPTIKLPFESQFPPTRKKSL